MNTAQYKEELLRGVTRGRLQQMAESLTNRIQLRNETLTQTCELASATIRQQAKRHPEDSLLTHIADSIDRTLATLKKDTNY